MHYEIRSEGEIKFEDPSIAKTFREYERLLVEASGTKKKFHVIRVEPERRTKIISDRAPN
jgi:hypothetical protein